MRVTQREPNWGGIVKCNGEQAPHIWVTSGSKHITLEPALLSKEAEARQASLLEKAESYETSSENASIKIIK